MCDCPHAKELPARWLPALPYALAGHAVRLAVAMIAIHPYASVVERMLGGLPSGDAALFKPGGLMLSEVFRLHGLLIYGLAEQGALVAIGMIPVGIVLNALVIAALVVGNHRKMREVVSLALDRLIPLAVLAVFAWLAVGSTVAASVVIREGLRAALPFDVRWNDLLSIVVWLLGGAVVVACSAVVDIARTTLVADRKDSAEAIVAALGVLQRQPLRVLGAFGVWASASLLLVLGSLAVPVWVGMTTTGQWVAIVLVQQVAGVGLVCLRTWWFAQALGYTNSSKST